MNEDGTLQKQEMHWPTVLLYIHLHAFGCYGLWQLLFEAKWLTVFFALFVILVAGLGITIGAHRLWAHESYIANQPLRLFLMLAHTLAGVGTIQDWVLSHRIHHKFYGTELDPYNHKNGFMYSHVLSNLMTPHPDQEKIVKGIDMRDVENDGFVSIQKRLYWILMPILAILLPLNAPVEYWGESIVNSLFILGFLRFTITVHMSWLVNSANLIWGLKPGEKYPAEGNALFFITKSQWPHYHYMVPWDYKVGEYGTYDRGCSTTFLKIWEILGLASCLKTATSEDIRKALAKVAITGSKIDDCLKDVHKSAEEASLKIKIAAKH